mmetsp:Transcript_31905/g.63205  ORF Transcript_31905/g.63205 Transcript_31905/m.63205 type:complete len:285 (+) Transcript_31905:333-1187(+)
MKSEQKANPPDNCIKSCIPGAPRNRHSSSPPLLHLIPGPYELRRNVAVRHLDHGRPRPFRSTPQFNDIKIIPHPVVIEGHGRSRGEGRVVPQLRFKHRPVVRDGRERRRVRAEPHRRSGRHVRHHAHVHHLAGPETERRKHPTGQKDVVGRRPKVDGPAHHRIELRRGRRPAGVRARHEPRRRDAFQPRHFKEPGHLDPPALYDPPEVHGEGHLVARLDVSMREGAGYRIEFLLREGHGDQAAGGGGLLRRGRARNYFGGVVVLHLLLQKGEIPRPLPAVLDRG